MSLEQLTLWGEATARPVRRRYKPKQPVWDDAGRRVCRVCHAPLSRPFYNYRRWPLHCSHRCREWEREQRYVGGRRCRCGAAKDKGRWRCDPCTERRSRRHRVQRYGVTVEWVEALLLQQGGACAICAAPIGWQSMHVDHDHACCNWHPTDGGGSACGGCVRGLLCPGCNVGLGAFHDSTARLESAVRYLEFFKSADSAHPVPLDFRLTLPVTHTNHTTGQRGGDLRSRRMRPGI